MERRMERGEARRTSTVCERACCLLHQTKKHAPVNMYLSELSALALLDPGALSSQHNVLLTQQILCTGTHSVLSVQDLTRT
jgi:hypothetical protein